MIDEGAQIRRNPAAVYRELADGTGGVVLLMDSAAYHGLNPVGGLIWDLLEQQRTFGELLERLREELESVPEAFSDEISEFLESLHDRQLVEIRKPET
ncbi:MAG: PqqD family peptide modification chaperone, partial [Actinobacteria bacterium]|nr:PqqD family peptide modification chaperone [Actinomycetota bacterium]